LEGRGEKGRPRRHQKKIGQETGGSLTSLPKMLQHKDPVIVDGDMFDADFLDASVVDEDDDYVQISELEVERDSESSELLLLEEEKYPSVAVHPLAESSYETLTLVENCDGFEEMSNEGSVDLIWGIRDTVAKSVEALFAQLDSVEEAVDNFEKKLSAPSSFQNKLEEKDIQCRELVRILQILIHFFGLSIYFRHLVADECTGIA
jgi:hypothetical protein